MRGAAVLALVSVSLLVGGCRKFSASAPNPVQALRRRVETGFRPPADGLLTDAQLDLFVRAARSGDGGRRVGSIAGAGGVDRTELAWIRGRVIEALLVLDARKAREGALESTAKATADLRVVRREARDPGAAARLDLEIAALERERASLVDADASAAAGKNAARIAPRRAEIEPLVP